MDPTPDSHVPAPTPLPPLVDRDAQLDLPMRTRFFTFALIGGGIACALFLLTFLTSLRAQTPHPQNNLKLNPIATPQITAPTPHPRAIASPQPVEIATSSGTQIQVFETPSPESSTIDLEVSPSAGISAP